MFCFFNVCDDDTKMVCATAEVNGGVNEIAKAADELKKPLAH
jgi:hypothetical protein